MAVSISPATLPEATQNEAYSVPITASGGTGPYTFAVTTGSAPAGLTLASNGTLSGTPQTAGTSASFTVTATDSTPTTPQTGTQSYTLTVNASGLIVVTDCPSVACKGAGPVAFIHAFSNTYTCPRCEQQSVISGTTATHAPGYHD